MPVLHNSRNSLNFIKLACPNKNDSCMNDMCSIFTTPSHCLVVVLISEYSIYFQENIQKFPELICDLIYLDDPFSVYSGEYLIIILKTKILGFG